MSKEIAPVALLSIVRAESLPLSTSLTILGVLLPECVSLGFGENRFTSCVGDDMSKCTMISLFPVNIKF
jgi:hypothetical protein